MTLEIPDNLRERLIASASRHNQTPTEYALQVLERNVPEERSAPSGPLPATSLGEPMPTTGAELVEYWRRHGVIGAWSDRDDIEDNLEFARELRRRAETRRGL